LEPWAGGAYILGKLSSTLSLIEKEHEKSKATMRAEHEKSEATIRANMLQVIVDFFSSQSPPPADSTAVKKLLEMKDDQERKNKAGESKEQTCEKRD